MTSSLSRLVSSRTKDDEGMNLSKRMLGSAPSVPENVEPQHPAVKLFHMEPGSR